MKQKYKSENKFKKRKKFKKFIMNIFTNILSVKQRVIFIFYSTLIFHNNLKNHVEKRILDEKHKFPLFFIPSLIDSQSES